MIFASVAVAECMRKSSSTQRRRVRRGSAEKNNENAVTTCGASLSRSSLRLSQRSLRLCVEIDSPGVQ